MRAGIVAVLMLELIQNLNNVKRSKYVILLSFVPVIVRLLGI